MSQSGTAITLTLNGGTLYSGTNPQTTDVNGKATFGDLVIRQAATGLTFGAAGGSFSGTSNPFNITADTAVQLAYTSVPGAGTPAMAFSVTVQSRDAYGNPANPTSTTTISLTKATGAGTLSGTLTGNIPTSGNSVPISGVLYSTPDTMTLTASATAGMTGLAHVTSGNIVFTATLGVGTVGSPSYPQLTNGNTTTDSQSGAGDYFVADPFTNTVPFTATTIYTYGTAAGGVEITLYNDNSGSPGTVLCGTNTYTSTASGWSAVTIPNTYLAAGKYWVVYNLNSSSASADYITRKTVAGFTRQSQHLNYGTAFPSNSGGWSNLNTGFASCLYVVGVPIEGYAKATKATLAAASTITSLSFYSHATGDFRLAIYSDSSGVPGAKQWESGSTAATASAWNTVNISAGTPTSLTLNAGTYWLAWQWDSPNSGPSYTLGAANTGDYLVQAYGSFPASWSGGTLSTENWSLYATYSSAPVSSTNALTSSANPALPGVNVTFTAAVSPVPPGVGTPTGTVVFKNGATPFSTNTLVSSSAATTSSTLPHGTNIITAEYSGDADFLTSTGRVAQVINTPPAAGTQNLAAAENTALNVTAATLASLNFDADGDPLTITAVSSTSTNGPANNVTFNGTTITYTPANSFVGADQFTYTISDGFPGGTATCTADVTVRLSTEATSQFTYVSASSGTVNLRGYGIPGKLYDVQRSNAAICRIGPPSSEQAESPLGRAGSSFTPTPARRRRPFIASPCINQSGD